MNHSCPYESGESKLSLTSNSQEGKKNYHDLLQIIYALADEQPYKRVTYTQTQYFGDIKI